MNQWIASALLLAGVGFGQATPAAAQGSSTRPVTYTHDVAAVLAEHCTTCHRTGGTAPFSLQTFADVRPRARRGR